MNLRLPFRHRAVDHPAAVRRNERVVELARGHQFALAFLRGVKSHDAVTCPAVEAKLGGLGGIPCFVAEPHDPRLGAGECQHLCRNTRRGRVLARRRLGGQRGAAGQEHRRHADSQNSSWVHVCFFYKLNSFCHASITLLELLPVYFAVPAGLATDENGTSDQPGLSVNSRAAKHQMISFLPAR